MRYEKNVLDTDCDYCGMFYTNCNLLFFEGGIKRFACHICTNKILEDNTTSIKGKVRPNGSINVGRKHAGKQADVYIRL